MAAAGVGGAEGWNPGLLTDPNCVALWNFEDGALVTDSKGGNTLTNVNGVTADTVNFKQGAASANIVLASNQKFTIADANLDSGFPAKSGETNRSFSLLGWVKPTILPNGYEFICKMDGPDSWRAWFYSSKLYFRIYDNAGGFTTINSGFTLPAVDRWYHIATTFDGDNGPNFAYRISIWDDFTGALVGADVTGTMTRVLNCAAGGIEIGDGANGKQDEFIVRNDVSSVDEITQIRQGIYGK